MKTSRGNHIWSRYSRVQKNMAAIGWGVVLPLTCHRCHLDVGHEHEHCPHCSHLDNIDTAILRLDHARFRQSCQRLGRKMLFAAAVLSLTLLILF